MDSRPEFQSAVRTGQLQVEQIMSDVITFEVFAFSAYIVTMISLYALYSKLARVWVGVPDLPMPGQMRWTLFLSAAVTAPIPVLMLTALSSHVVSRL